MPRVKWGAGRPIHEIEQDAQGPSSDERAFPDSLYFGCRTRYRCTAHAMGMSRFNSGWGRRPNDWSNLRIDFPLAAMEERITELPPLT